MAQENQKQKQLITEVMQADEKDGLYESTKSKTAVEWLWNELCDKGYFKKLPISEIKQAKQMEKEQIQKAFSDGQETPINHPTLPHYSREEYYNDTYKTT